MLIGLRLVGRLACVMGLLGAASACSVAGMAVGAGATAGVAASQERGIESAIDDNKIGLEVNRLLIAEDPELFTAVSTEIVEGRVLLTGQVATQDARLTAARLAWRAPGVREIINEIQVAESDGIAGYSKDVWISTKLRARLLADTEIAALNYTVETVRGTVYLMGIAQNDAELRRAINHARDISGVRNVVSYVQLKNDPSRPTLPGQATRGAPPE